MQTETKEFPAEVLLAVLHNQAALVPQHLPELLAWMTGESWKPEDHKKAIEICIPWLRAWFPELAKQESQPLSNFYSVPQINR